MGKTKIEYADEVSNPLQAMEITSGKMGTFCEKPDPEGTCKNCWAETLNMKGKPDNSRFGNGLAYDRVFRDRVVWKQHEKEMRRLTNLNARKPMSTKFPGNALVVFTNDTYDLFQPSISDELRDWVFGNYDTFHNLNILIQTTYVSLMRKFLTARYPMGMPRQFIVGMSAGEQKFFDDNIDHLLTIWAERYYVIAEPLLGPMNISRFVDCHQPERHWLITGGESGPNARPMHPRWALDLRDQCIATGVHFLFKQWGEYISGQPGDLPYREPDHCWNDPGDFASFRVGKKKAGRLLDGKIWNQFPTL